MTPPEDPSPFDDPEVQRFMAQHRIVHKPGMAAGLMRELEPLLAVEGYDPDDPDKSDLDTLNAAMARAVEQRNLLLFTPGDANRTQALGFLRRYAQAVADGDRARARRLLDSIEPEETAKRPAASHIIGVSAGLLDSWSRDGNLKRGLKRARATTDDARVRSAATDLLALARKHRAFDSIDSLIKRHRGKALTDAGAEAVAAAVAAIAGSSESIAAVCRRLLLDDAALAEVGDFSMEPGGAGRHPTGSGAASGSAFFKSTPAGLGALFGNRGALREEFRTWTIGALEFDVDEADDDVEMLDQYLDGVEQGGPDISEPESLDEFVEFLEERAATAAPDQFRSVMGAVEFLHDWVGFAQHADPNPGRWDDVHFHIDDLLFSDEDDGDADTLDALIDAIPMPDPDTAMPLLSRSLIVTAVPELLRWIGDRHKITQSGVVRRADIHDVAAMIGVSAEGVATRPKRGPLSSLTEPIRPLPEPDPQYATSMNEVPMLYAWWHALRAAEVIAVNTSSVSPGGNAAWLATPENLAFDEARVLVGSFVTYLLLHPYVSAKGELDASLGAQRVRDAAERLMEAIAPHPELESEPEDEADEIDVLAPYSLRTLKRLERIGLLSLGPGPEFAIAVPQPLEPLIMRAAAAALSIVEHDY